MAGRCPFPHELFTRRRKTDEPASPQRRALFKGAAFAGGVALLNGFSARSAYAAVPADTAEDPTLATVPFYGPHQAGIVNPAPAAGIVVAFNVLASDRAALTQLFRTLTQRFAFLTQGGKAETAADAFPPPDSGLLGPVVTPNRLTLTLAVGASLFDDRFGLKAVKPAQLDQMPAFPNDKLDADWCHGDLLIQFCSESPEVNLHALRDIVKHTPALLMVRWKQDGFLPQSAVESKAKLTPRNLLGFKDGTANPDRDDGKLMDELVWVQPSDNEPTWTAGGSYQVVRIIRMLVEQWDRTALHEQQNIFGRSKMSGAPLDGMHEADIPDYAADPKGLKTPLTAHIRLANPRTPETQANLILRRPYNYSRGANAAGQLDMGLLFNCFQADLNAGFVTVQSRLDGEPLEEYVKPTGGGYFFVLPGVADSTHFLGQSMLQASVMAGA